MVPLDHFYVYTFTLHKIRMATRGSPLRVRAKYRIRTPGDLVTGKVDVDRSANLTFRVQVGRVCVIRILMRAASRLYSTATPNITNNYVCLRGIRLAHNMICLEP